MATAAVATSPSLSSDPRGQLRVSQTAERRNRIAAPEFHLPAANNNLGFISRNQFPTNASLGASEIDTTAANNTASYSRDETYRRSFQANQIKHQIGQSAGLDLNRQPSNEESTELEDLQQEEAARETEFFARNQAGEDRRLSGAKRAQLESMASKSMDKGLQFLGEKAAKELSAVGINSLEDLLEALDDGEDLFVFQVVNGVLSVGKGVRAIFPGKLASSDDPKNLKELVAKNAMTLLDVIFPPVGISSGSKISGMLGLLIYGLMFSFVLLVLGFVVIIIYTLLNPWSTTSGVINTMGNAALGNMYQQMTE